VKLYGGGTNKEILSFPLNTLEDYCISDEYLKELVNKPSTWKEKELLLKLE
jgi:hypothetical protein